MFSDVPYAPCSLRVSEVDSSRAVVAWDAPLSDGGSPITQYHVELCRSGSVGGWTRVASVDGTTLTAQLTGLTEGDFYFVRVFAENQAGLSKKASELVDAFCARKPLSKTHSLPVIIALLAVNWQAVVPDETVAFVMVVKMNFGT